MLGRTPGEALPLGKGKLRIGAGEIGKRDPAAAGQRGIGEVAGAPSEPERQWERYASRSARKRDGG